VGPVCWRGLKELGIEDNTILIFLERQRPDAVVSRAKRAGGLRGSKISLYEGRGIGKPLIVRWPGHVPAGRVDDQSVISGVDFFFPCFAN